MKKWSPFSYIRNYKFNSLFLKNFILIDLVVFLPLILMCAAVYLYFQETYLREIEASSQNTLYRIQETADTVMDNIRLMGINLCQEEGLLEFLDYTGDVKSDYEGAQQLVKLRRLLAKNTNEYVHSVYVYSEANGYVITGTDSERVQTMSDSSWIELYERNKIQQGSTVWPRMRLQRKDANKYPCISVAFYLPYQQNKGKKGALILNMNNSWLDKLMDISDRKLSDFYVVDQEGIVVYNHDPEKLNHYITEYLECSGEEFIREEGYMVNGRPSANGKWNYLYITDLQQYYERLNRLKGMISLVGLLLFMVSVAVSFLISVRVFLPVERILQLLEDPKAFYDTSRMEKEHKDSRNELKYITSSFLESYSKQEQNRKELTKYVTSLKEAQIALLQAQINPHFLFNTLQSINFMAIAVTGTDNDLCVAIGMLSTMMRYMMEVDYNMVTLEKEIEYSKAYIGLEQLRYGDSLQVKWDIEPQLMECRTVKVTLQPILENCIRHGFKNMKCGGNIEVKGKLENEKILIMVRDDGVSQDEEWISSMNRELEEFQPVISRHIGIRNVNQRIRMLFGNEYGLHILKVQTGFTVVIWLPVLREEV